VEYNTQLPKLVISEYGRIIQDLVYLAKQEADKTKRTRLAHGIVQVMENLNPTVKEQADYKHKLWDHLFIIADYDFDIDAPFDPPTPDIISQKPDNIPYSDQPIKFRFYGRNLQNMVAEAKKVEDPVMKTELINQLASFMKNSSRNWNSENLTNEMIADHISSMSQGILQIEPDALEIKIEARRKKNFKPNKPNKSNKYKKFNRNR
jgi:hypothetical protein